MVVNLPLVPGINSSITPPVLATYTSPFPSMATPAGVPVVATLVTVDEVESGAIISNTPAVIEGEDTV